MIYVFLANGFEEVEALTPVDMLRRCGLETVLVGVGGKTVKSSHGVIVETDVAAEDIKPDANLEMVILPGGMPGTLNLEKSAEVQKAIDFCVENDRYVAAICAAPSILGHRGLLKGKTAVCYTGFEAELTGASIGSEPVYTDGKIITSKGAGTALEFSFELVKNLVSEERMNILKESVIYKK